MLAVRNWVLRIYERRRALAVLCAAAVTVPQLFLSTIPFAQDFGGHLAVIWLDQNIDEIERGESFVTTPWWWPNMLHVNLTRLLCLVFDSRISLTILFALAIAACVLALAYVAERHRADPLAVFCATVFCAGTITSLGFIANIMGTALTIAGARLVLRHKVSNRYSLALMLLALLCFHAHGFMFLIFVGVTGFCALSTFNIHKLRATLFSLSPACLLWTLWYVAAQRSPFLKRTTPAWNPPEVRRHFFASEFLSTSDTQLEHTLVILLCCTIVALVSTQASFRKVYTKRWLVLTGVLVCLIAFSPMFLGALPIRLRIIPTMVMIAALTPTVAFTRLPWLRHFLKPIVLAGVFLYGAQTTALAAHIDRDLFARLQREVEKAPGNARIYCSGNDFRYPLYRRILLHNCAGIIASTGREPFAQFARDGFAARQAKGPRSYPKPPGAARDFPWTHKLVVAFAKGPTIESPWWSPNLNRHGRWSIALIDLDARRKAANEALPTPPAKKLPKPPAKKLPKPPAKKR